MDNKKIDKINNKEVNKAKTIKEVKPAKTLDVADIKNKVSPKTKRVVSQNKKKEN